MAYWTDPQALATSSMFNARTSQKLIFCGVSLIILLAGPPTQSPAQAQAHIVTRQLITYRDNLVSDKRRLMDNRSRLIRTLGDQDQYLRQIDSLLRNNPQNSGALLAIRSRLSSDIALVERAKFETERSMLKADDELRRVEGLISQYMAYR